MNPTPDLKDLMMRRHVAKAFGFSILLILTLWFWFAK